MRIQQKRTKNKKSENGYQAGDFEAMYEMRNRFFEGWRGTPDCCSGMKKIWKKMQDNSQGDKKQK